MKILSKIQKTKDYKLTEYSTGAGWGCKLSPSQLNDILNKTKKKIAKPELLVGNDTKDDAAAYMLDDKNIILSTCDFFMPIVDDAYNFGKIAACNALSDIYAMGGKPLMALAILAWPNEKLPLDIASKVLQGGIDICEENSIPIAGGHSISASEPIYGLSVNGITSKDTLIKNSSGKANSYIYISKKIGTGIITTAMKNKKASDKDIENAVEVMSKLNNAGYEFAKSKLINTMTDITGFGLLGHLYEICKASDITARINYSDVPLIENTEKLALLNQVPGGTINNFNTYKSEISEITELQRNILADPQTSGGLMVLVEKDKAESFEKLAKDIDCSIYKIGETTEQKEKVIEILW